ncbi:MAG: hypothetical protein EOM24_26365 [Chloroflexia bacterium]|nr:hypothetical protein [Chloroflexia bacterium]
MAYRFFGEGKVWDAARDRVLCAFVNGEFVTDDEYVITHLRKNNYPYENLNASEPETAPKADAGPIPEMSVTRREIMAELDKRGISYNARAKKAELEALL